MKGCLKLKSPLPSPSLPSYPSPSSSSSHPRKTVAFGEEEVYFADVWDRTPTAPARRLTYQDLQELKEIQRSLPLAQQLPDPVSGKIPSQYLDTVPIGLLPLLADDSPAISPSPTLPPWPTISPPTPTLNPRGPAPPSTSWVPAHMQHLVPKRPPPQPKKRTFEFLPLLDTPPSSGAPSPYTSPLSLSPSPSPPPDNDEHSDQDPPTPSLTNNSLESSPLSRASSSSPEPAFLSLDPDTDLDTDFPLPPLALSHTTAWHAFPAHTRTCKPRTTPPPLPPPPNPRRKNVMILNGIEIELELDDDESHTPPSIPSILPSARPPPPPPPPQLHAPIRFKRGPTGADADADVVSPWAG